MKDLTKGSIVRLILAFAFPVFLGNLLQLTYNIADTKIVSLALGEQALAAVGATNSLNTLVIGFLTGLTNGFAVIAAQYFGADDRIALRHTVAAAIQLGVSFSLLMTAAVLLWLKPILRLLNTPEEILPVSYAYIFIIFAGMTVLMLYNVCSALLRAIGDTVTPLVFLAISVAGNIGGDWAFVVIFHWGVQGAAWATVLSQLVAMLACFIYMFRKYPFLRPRREDFSCDRELMGKLLGSGVSMGLMGSLVSFGTVALQFSINTFGTEIIVAHTAARKLTELFMLLFSVMGTTMATFCGQNYGAGQYLRVRKGIYIAVALAWGWGLVSVILTYTLAPWMVAALTSSDNPVIIGTACWYLRVDTVFYFVPAMICIIRNSMQGIGDRITPIVSSFIELAGKVLVVIFLVPVLQYFGIILAEPIVWILMVIPLLVQLWRNPKMMQARKEEARIRAERRAEQ